MLTEAVVRDTFLRWQEKTHFTYAYKGRNRAGLRRDGKNTVSFLVTWPKRIPIDKVAYCKNWYNRKGNIIESDIIFNMLITKFTTLKTNKPDSYFIEGVLSHEIGHMLGLPHSTLEKSVMNPDSTPEKSYNKGDIDTNTLAVYRKMYGIKH